jgi:hypothetical protein
MSLRLGDTHHLVELRILGGRPQDSPDYSYGSEFVGLAHAGNGRTAGQPHHQAQVSLAADSEIVIVTALGLEDISTQAEEIGIDSYLVKPVNQSLLYDTLVDLFGVAVPSPDCLSSCPDGQLAARVKNWTMILRSWHSP